MLDFCQHLIKAFIHAKPDSENAHEAISYCGITEECSDSNSYTMTSSYKRAVCKLCRRLFDINRTPY